MYENRLFEDICDYIEGFSQFKTHKESCTITITKFDNNVFNFSVNFRRFDGIDISKINCYNFGPVDGTYFRNIEGTVTSGGPDGIHINFRAISRNFVKNIHGYFSDGPHTTLLPKTLLKLLKEKNIESDLIDEIESTIEAQCSSMYNEGWKEARDLYKQTD